MSEREEVHVLVRCTCGYFLSSAHMERPLKPILTLMAQFREIMGSRAGDLYWATAKQDFQLVLDILRDTRHSKMESEFEAVFYYPYVVVDAGGRLPVIKVVVGRGKKVELRTALTSFKRVQKLLDPNNRFWERIVDLYDNCTRCSRGALGLACGAWSNG